MPHEKDELETAGLADTDTSSESDIRLPEKDAPAPPPAVKKPKKSGKRMATFLGKGQIVTRHHGVFISGVPKEVPTDAKFGSQFKVEDV